MGSASHTVQCRVNGGEARTLERLEIGLGELFHRHRGRTGDDLDEVVGAREDTVAVVLGDVAEVLNQKLAAALGPQVVGELTDLDGLVAHRDTHCARELFGDLVVV